MSEQSMRNTVKRHIDVRPNAHWQRLEDSLTPGVPDINFCLAGNEIWIEAKVVELEKLPKKATTPVRMGLKVEQAQWAISRRAAGGKAFVLCKIGLSWFLFNDSFLELHHGVPMRELGKLACEAWTGAFDLDRVLRAM